MVGLDYLELSFKTLGIISACVFVTVILMMILKATHCNKHIVRIPLWLLAFVFVFGILEIPLIEIYKNRNSLCRDSEILNQLQNDEKSSEFVLDGKYYSLPCPLEDFTDDGWVSIKNYKGEIVPIDALTTTSEGYMLFSLPTTYGTLSLIADISSVKKQEIVKVSIIGAFYTSDTHRKDLYKLPNLDLFVTKKGITETTDFQDARNLTEGLHKECLYVMERNQTEPMSPDIYGNCYDMLTPEISDDLYDLTKTRYHTGYISDSPLLPHENRFLLDKSVHSEKSVLSFNAARLIMLAVLSVIAMLIACPIIIKMIHKNSSKSKKEPSAI